MTRRLIGQLHLWLGLALCAPLVLLGLTGSVLVFEDELRAVFASGPAAQPGEPRSVGEIVAAARAAAPQGFAPSGYVAPEATGRLAAVRLSPMGAPPGPGEVIRIDVDPVSLATYPNASNDFLRQVFFLHSTLLMKNRTGRQLVGWLGVAMLLMAASGLVNWWPRRGTWVAAIRVSADAHGFRLWRELHGMAGFWGFAVLGIVSLAGVDLAFPDTVRSILGIILPARDLRAAASAKVQPVKGTEPLGIDDAVGLARAGVPGARLSMVFLPSRPDQPYRIALQRAGEEPPATPVTVVVDPWARRVVETLDPRQFNAGETLLAAQHSLHAGRGFGPLWTALVFLCGLLPALLAATGIAMWLKRRRPGAAVIRMIDQPQTARRAGE